VAKPVVDGLERELGDRAQVLRLSVTDDVSAQLAAHFGVRAVPTLLLFDGTGEPVLTQVGIPKRDEIVEAVERLERASRTTDS
jgi:thioredoxin-like negative regulator of GroEL